MASQKGIGERPAKSMASYDLSEMTEPMANSASTTIALPIGGAFLLQSALMHMDQRWQWVDGNDPVSDNDWDELEAQIAALMLAIMQDVEDFMSIPVGFCLPLAGTTAGGQSGGDTRYVFAIYFDGATAGIPYLEAWDDNTHATSAHNFLGGGTPANSSIKAIATTNAVPGSATWAGTPLAGLTSRISLDAAALTVAKNLYFNIKQLVTQGTHTPGSSTALVLTLRYLYS